MAARLHDSIGGRAAGRRLSRAGTQYQTQSMRYHTAVVPALIENFLFLYSNNPLSISTVIVVSP